MSYTDPQIPGTPPNAPQVHTDTPAEVPTNGDAVTPANAATVDGDWNAQDRPADGSLYYCPACGKRVEYRQQCVGSNAQAPHPPTEVVDAVELWDARRPEEDRDPLTGRQYDIGALDPNKLTAGPAVE